MAQYKRKKGDKIVKTKKNTYPFKGINYKSSLEKNMAMCLDSAGIEFEYESMHINVLEGFQFGFKSYERQSNGKGEFENRGEKKVLGIVYTPDFVGDGFIIETKGYANETFPMRYKLFKKWLTSNFKPGDMVIYKPQNKAECQKVVELILQNQNVKTNNGNRKSEDNQ